jgi:hypothetical protein
MIPFLKQSHTIHGKTDPGKILTNNHFEKSRPLVIDQVDILVVVANDANHIPEIDLMTGNEADVEFKLKILCKTKGIIRGKIKKSPFFLDYLMTIENQTIRLAGTTNFKK